MTIIKQVVADANKLRDMQRRDLFAWADAHGMNSRSAFPRFKKALVEIGVDYKTAGVAAREPQTELERAVAFCREQRVINGDARIWSRDCYNRVYLPAQRGTDLYVAVEVISHRIEGARAVAFVSTKQHRNWVMSQKERAKEAAQPVVDAILFYAFRDRAREELNGDQAATLARVAPLFAVMADA